jgi:hypothetical protein
MSDTIEVERRNSVTIKLKKKFKKTASDDEWETVVKQYYDGGIQEAINIIDEFNDKKGLNKNTVDTDKNKPTTFSSTL